MQRYLNKKHQQFFKDNSRELLFYGGAGAGKSYSVSDKLLLNSIRWKKATKTVIVRKTLPSIKKTCIPIISERASLFNIPIKLNKSESVMHLPFDSQFIFISINNIKDIEKVKSLTNVDVIWIEEAHEIIEESYEELKRRLRGGKGGLSQIICSFNPVGTTSWLYDRFFIRNVNDVRKIKTNIYDNEYLIKKDPEYVRDLESLKDSNMSLYNVYCLGNWGSLKGVCYDNYTIADQTILDFFKYPDETIYGLDFGYNVPSALVEIKIKDNRFLVKELIYETHLTNSQLIEKIKTFKISSNDPIYCDNAEPDRIQDICNAGFNAKPADKNVKDGILFVKELEIYYHSDSDNLKKEAGSYCWKTDKDGNDLDEPVKLNDHLMDGKRYGIYTHCKKRIVVPAPSTIKQHRRIRSRSKVSNLPT
jgi:phage terminase large subunit